MTAAPAPGRDRLEYPPLQEADMFRKQDSRGYSTPIAKIRQKTLVHGEKTLLAEFRLDKGAVLPDHRHPHEQTGYLVTGRMELTIGGQPHLVEPGDSWCIAGNTPHSALALEDSVAVEAFSPVREDYLPQGE
ncbi:cupin domain-containing protein [Desulfuromonas versatilis]